MSSKSALTPPLFWLFFTAVGVWLFAIGEVYIKGISTLLLIAITLTFLIISLVFMFSKIDILDDGLKYENKLLRKNIFIKWDDVVKFEYNKSKDSTSSILYDKQQKILISSLYSNRTILEQEIIKKLSDL